MTEATGRPAHRAATAGRGAAWSLIGALAVATGALAVLAALVGAYPVSPGDATRAVLAWLTGDLTGATVETVLLEVRLPRIAAALLVGAALAGAGAVYQGLFRTRWSRPTSSASRPAPGSAPCSASSCRCRSC